MDAVHLRPHSNTTPLNYTTLHYTTLHYTTLHYTTLHYTTLLHHTTPLPTTLLEVAYTFRAKADFFIRENLSQSVNILCIRESRPNISLGHHLPSAGEHSTLNVCRTSFDQMCQLLVSTRSLNIMPGPLQHYEVFASNEIGFYGLLIIPFVLPLYAAYCLSVCSIKSLWSMHEP